jgi:hypothetical protein
MRAIMSDFLFILLCVTLHDKNVEGTKTTEDTIDEANVKVDKGNACRSLTASK